VPEQTERITRKKRIFGLLTKTPGLTAKRIAAALSLKVTVVNSILYGSRRDSTILDPGNHWRVSIAPKRIKRFSVYVVKLKDAPNEKGRLSVGMTGLTPEKRLDNHMRGYLAARVVTKYGDGLLPEFYEHLNPMSWKDACQMEKRLAADLRLRDYIVYQN